MTVSGMSIHLWIAFAIAYSLMAAAPGPTVLLVMSYALSQGRRTAFAVVAGTSLADATCLAAAVLGAGAVLAASATAFLVLKLAGAAYLIYLGVKLWKAPVLALDAPAPPPGSASLAFVHAYFTTVFNPKSILFFMIFVPQFLNERAPLGPQLAEMVATVLVCGAAIDGAYTVFAAALRRFIRTPRAQRRVNRATGGLLVGEGVLAAVWRAAAL
jgi:threonine/homoserine/homoserine lactone efflux protein